MNAKLSLILAMVIFGTLPIFVRHIPLSSQEIVLGRLIFALIFLLSVRLWQVWRKRQAEQNSPSPAAPSLTRTLGSKEGLLLLLSGLALGANWIFLFEAYALTTVSVATLCYYMAPLLMIIFSALVYKERPARVLYAAFPLCLAGFALLVGFQADGANNMHGVLFGLAAALFYAAVVMLNKGIRGVAGMDKVLLQFCAAFIVFAPYQLISGGISLFSLPLEPLLFLLAIGFVHTGFAYCLYFSAVSTLKGQDVAVLSYIDPLVAVLLSVLLLGEGMNPWQMAGAALILGSTLWCQLKENN